MEILDGKMEAKGAFTNSRRRKSYRIHEDICAPAHLSFNEGLCSITWSLKVALNWPL